MIIGKSALKQPVSSHETVTSQHVRRTLRDSQYIITRNPPIASGDSSSSITHEFEDRNVIAGIEYTYTVSGGNAVGEGEQSDSFTITPAVLCTPPAPPTGLSAESGDGRVLLTWAIVSPMNHNVYRNNTKITAAAVSGNNYNDMGLINQTSYTYNITAVSTDGCESGMSSSVTAIPTEPTASPVVQFELESSAVGEGDGSFIIYVVRSGNLDEESTVNFVSSNDSATGGSDYTSIFAPLTFGDGEEQKTIEIPIINDESIEGDEKFTITLTALTNATLGNNSIHTATINDDDFGLSAPTNVAAVGSIGEETKIGRIVVTWNVVDNATHYDVYRTDDSDAEYPSDSWFHRRVMSSSPLELEYDNLPEGTKRRFVVVAGNNARVSPPSDIVEAVVPPASQVPSTPKNITVSHDGAHAFWVQWDSVPHASSYHLYMSSNPTDEMIELYTDQCTSVSSSMCICDPVTDEKCNSEKPNHPLSIRKHVDGLDLGKKYYFSVSAKNSKGESEKSSRLLEIPWWNQSTSMDIPMVKSISNEGSVVKFSITKALNGHPKAYNIYRSTNPDVAIGSLTNFVMPARGNGPTCEVDDPNATEVECRDNPRTFGTYYYVLTSVIGKNESKESVKQTVHLSLGVPVLSVDVQDSTANLSWSRVVGATQYTIERSIDGYRGWKKVKVEDIEEGIEETNSFSDLLGQCPGTFYYRATAGDGIDYGDYSNIVQAADTSECALAEVDRVPVASLNGSDYPYVDLGIDEDGNVTVVWNEDHSQGGQSPRVSFVRAATIQMSGHGMNGQFTKAPTIISEMNDDRQIGGPLSLGVASNGNAVATYESVSSVSRKYLAYASTFDVKLNEWSSAIISSDEKTGFSLVNSNAAYFNDESMALVAWSDNDHDGDVLYVSRYSARDKKWINKGEKFLNVAPSTIVIETNHAGVFHLVGNGKFTGASADAIWYKGYPSTISYELLSADGAPTTNPDFAVDGTGKGISVWEDSIGGGGKNKISYSSYDGSSWTKGGAILNSGDGNATKPKIAMTPNGRALVVWQQLNDAGKNVIMARGYNGKKWDDNPIQLSQDDQKDMQYPLVASAEKDAFAVVWYREGDDSSSDGGDLAFRKVGLDGTMPAEVVSLSRRISESSKKTYSIASNPKGKAYAAWSVLNDDETYSIYLYRLSQ